MSRTYIFREPYPSEVEDWELQPASRAYLYQEVSFNWQADMVNAMNYELRRPRDEMAMRAAESYEGMKLRALLRAHMDPAAYVLYQQLSAFSWYDDNLDFPDRLSAVENALRDTVGVA